MVPLAARKFNVTIGGITYQVEVEEVGAAGGAPAIVPAPVASAPPPAPVRSAPPAPEAPKSAARAATPARQEPAGAGEVVRAPLPGMVVSVRVEVGQRVKAGDVLAVLEAMKMENDVTAPTAGTVSEILVEKGTPVSLGDALVVIG